MKPECIAFFRPTGIAFACLMASSFLSRTVLAQAPVQLTTLVEFTGNGAANKGASPTGLVRGSDGNFYGTTFAGGANGYGTVFRMTPAGALITLVEFTGKGEANRGAFPEGTLVQAKDGNFYGTTSGQGGTVGDGTAFKMTPAGVLTTLVEFTNDAPPNRGSDPHAGLVEGSDGNFYGTTFAGGLTKTGGTIFKMTSDGKLTTLINFKIDISRNGLSGPWCSLIQARDGNFYGTTWMGGGVPGGAGTVFRMTAAGSVTIVGRLTGGPGPKSTGGGPMSGVVQGSDGNFYGTTPVFGLHQFGTVYRMTPGGAVTALVHFTDNGATNKGRDCKTALLQGRDGNFYGTTAMGGANGWGTVFRMTPAGALTTLVEFTNTSGANKGCGPSALVQGSDGCLYGTTNLGGTNSVGTIFKITLGPGTTAADKPVPAASVGAVPTTTLEMTR